MSQVTEQSVRFQTALASIKLIQASAVLDLTEDDFDFLTSNKVWIATDRSRARRCVEACVYGTLDFVGYPRFPAPVEFIAAKLFLILKSGVNHTSRGSISTSMLPSIKLRKCSSKIITSILSFISGRLATKSNQIKQLIRNGRSASLQRTFKKSFTSFRHSTRNKTRDGLIRVRNIRALNGRFNTSITHAYSIVIGSKHITLNATGGGFLTASKQFRHGATSKSRSNTASNSTKHKSPHLSGWRQIISLIT